MSITNSNNGTNNNNNNNENNNNKKSKESLRELSYLIEEERLLADLKRKSEETLQKLRVEEITLLRFVRGLADQAGGSNRPIMLQDDLNTQSNVSINNNLLNNQTSSIHQQQQLNTLKTTQTSIIPNTLATTSNSTISSIEQDVNNSVLKLNVDNILMSIDNDQENEMEEIEENGH